ncbi:MAG: S-layer protein, partial [Candidatus Micrarchaeaceae archaeon]
MKHINAKRIAAVVTGAALLGVGLAAAGQVTYGSLPIINNMGQPVVQVVIGHAAQPSDGVAAGNIAAAIGNLAYTKSQVVPTVNATNAYKVLHVSISSPKYTLANQQVWLNESSTSFASGTYSFAALIGSVLNHAVQVGSLQNTKYLNTGNSYAYPDKGSGTYSTTVSPADSPYTDVGYIPLPNTVSASTNGGGVSFSSFANSTYDNILQVSNAQLPSLLNNYGKYGENEYLWLTGFPVYDQQSSVNAFALLDA